MTTSSNKMKIINFSIDKQPSLRYKFRTTEPSDVLENYIRRELNIPNSVMLSFVDLKDNTVVSISLLSDLEDESCVDIILKPLDRLTTSTGQQEK